MNLGTILKNQTIKMLTEISVNEDKDFDDKKASDFFKETYLSKFEKIVDNAKKEAKNADIMGNLNDNQIDPLVSEVSKISILHGLSEYAKEIFEYSKIE